jgi:hypothetical protein
MTKDQLTHLLQNHHNVVGYVHGVANTLAEILAHAEELVASEDAPAEMVEAFARSGEAMRQDLAAVQHAVEVLSNPGVVMSVMVKIADLAEAEEEPEYRFTSRERAQA